MQETLVGLSARIDELVPVITLSKNSNSYDYNDYVISLPLHQRFLLRKFLPLRVVVVAVFFKFYNGSQSFQTKTLGLSSRLFCLT